ncbi:MAG TPA: FAD-dependent oxidoreductase [Bacillota bacterium]|nr:FAD-dependent oxidoreductase [Bacillota bacterium]
MSKIIIIGAGIAGLAAGCYGQLNDYETEIYEMHNLPGGLCTSWNRKDYTIDGCIHWLMGTNPQSRFYQSWNDIGALAGREFLTYDEIMQVECATGRKLILYSDMDRLEDHLLELAPADAAIIKELTEAVRTRAIFLNQTPPDNLAKYGAITICDFVQRFQEPHLREAFLAFAPGEYPMSSLILQLAVYQGRDAVWPVGGSLEFARGIERRYLALGGRIHYQAKVEEILINSNRATGIKLSDGAEIPADFVISAADGYATIFGMLGGQWLDEGIKALYGANAKISRTSVQVSFGVHADLSDQPYFLKLKLDQPFWVGGVANHDILIRNYSYDRTLCLPAKSVLTATLYTHYEDWEALAWNPEAYRNEKEQIAGGVQEIINDRYPTVRGKIEVVDTATPVTYHRYTGIWKGAYCGWAGLPQKIPATLPGLSRFYMAGQWTQPVGGLPTALMTGKGSVIRICKEDEKAFFGAPGSR